jgi:16S rRNA (uracil1498-N3)-methyltransferase
MVRLPVDEAKHATRTLRLREGSAVELCDGRGVVAAAELAAADKAGATARTVAAAVEVPRATWQWEVALACGSLKGGRADWVVEKCAELGAAALVPLLTQRSPAVGGGRGGDKADGSGRREQREEDAEGGSGGGSGREARWGRVATAAMKQSLRAHSMVISPPATVAQLCAGLGGATAAFVGVEGAPPVHLATAALAARLGRDEPGAGHRRGVLIIGPEGDFTPEEVQELQAAGATAVGLGPLRLRAETAAVGLLAFATLALPGRGPLADESDSAACAG